MTTWNSSNANIDGDKTNKTLTIASDLRHEDSSVDLHNTYRDFNMKLKSENEKLLEYNKELTVNLKIATNNAESLLADVNRLMKEKDDIKKEYEDREMKSKETFNDLTEADDTSGDSNITDRLAKKVSFSKSN